MVLLSYTFLVVGQLMQNFFYSSNNCSHVMFPILSASRKTIRASVEELFFICKNASHYSAPISRIWNLARNRSILIIYWIHFRRTRERWKFRWSASICIHRSCSAMVELERFHRPINYTLTALQIRDVWNVINFQFHPHTILAPLYCISIILWKKPDAHAWWIFFERKGWWCNY